MKTIIDVTPSPNTVEILQQDVNINNIIQHKVDSLVNRDEPDDSFFVCDLGDIVAKHKRWQENFPRVRPHYAIKANPDRVFLKFMLAMGTGFDCASKSEIGQMLELGADPDDIIYANPCKQASHIRFARDRNVKQLVFDSKNELIKIKKHFPDAELVLRIQTDDSAAICQFSMKYGCPIDECRGLIQLASDMGLNVVGISFHVGSGCQSSGAFLEPLANARKLFDFADTLGLRFHLLDIGGGFPGSDHGVALSFEEIAGVVNGQLYELFPEENFPKLRVIAEPGRFYAASAFTLATNIIAKKEAAGAINTGSSRSTAQRSVAAKGKEKGDMPEGEEEGELPEGGFMYYINDGVYGAFNCLFFDHAIVSPSLLQENRMKGEVTHPCSIWGPTCDGLDKVCDLVHLPEHYVGDWLVWKDMGAYTLAAASSFNGFNTKDIFYFISEQQLCLLMKLAVGRSATGTIRRRFRSMCADDLESKAFVDVRLASAPFALSFDYPGEGQQQQQQQDLDSTLPAIATPV